jgi:hypothetical protein
MNVWCVCVVLCLSIGLATGWSPVQGVLPSVKNDYGTEKESKALNGLEEPFKRNHWYRELNVFLFLINKTYVMSNSLRDCFKEVWKVQFARKFSYIFIENLMRVEVEYYVALQNRRTQFFLIWMHLEREPNRKSYFLYVHACIWKVR